ncbi:MAG TPA: hypothetical protein VM012_08465 [Flavitalea sp.]|nr:hypothetical protein [Flavitalea sp.]
MKQILRAYSIVIFLSVFTQSAVLAAGEPQVEKKKTYNKSYDVDNNDVISLKNQFGEMRINTWDRNEVKVEVTITSKANTEERAQEILDKISIEDGKNGNGVYFKTNWKNDKDEDKKEKSKKEEHREEGMTINYLVYLPSRNPIDISNQFGATIIPDISGETRIESQFGTLDAGNLSNVKDLSIQFGSGEVESVNNGKLNFQFNNKPIVVKRITGDVTVQIQHCKSNSVKLNVDNAVKSMNLHNSFSDVIVSVPNNFSATYNVSTSHGSFTNKSNFAIAEEERGETSKYGPQFNHKYSGNSGNGASKIRISTDFGEVVIAHSMDVKLESKSTKEKKRTTVI